MKKQYLLFLAILIITTIGSYYYGAQRGVEAGGNGTKLIFANKSILQMDMHAATLLSLQSNNSTQALQLTEALVKNDMKHLEGIEKMLLNIETDEKSAEVVKTTIKKIRDAHKRLKNL
jgi:hypothetical protein